MIGSPVNVNRESLNSGPVANGKLHWLITGYANPNSRFRNLNRILYFDPLTDEFVELPMPSLPDNRKGNAVIIRLGVSEGCLCMARYVCEWSDRS